MNRERIAVLRILVFGLALILFIAGCARSEPPPAQAIIGQWVNSGGGTVHFYADGNGFIPGDENVTPAISAVNFTYTFVDDTHVGIKMDQQDPVVIEIELEGDKMTWRLMDGDEFVYMRAGGPAKAGLGRP